MTETPNDPSRSPDDDAAPEDKVGVEVGMTDGEGSTFEPEEDPGAAADS